MGLILLKVKAMGRVIDTTPASLCVSSTMSSEACRSGSSTLPPLPKSAAPKAAGDPFRNSPAAPQPPPPPAGAGAFEGSAPVSRKASTSSASRLPSSRRVTGSLTCSGAPG
jgi:hypothetical protein